jgi:leucyl aminopeptidase
MKFQLNHEDPLRCPCPVRWAHLDIAGTAWEEKGRHYLPKGATGVGLRLLVEYLRGLC